MRLKYETDPSADLVEAASPVCYARGAKDTYMGCLDREALIDALNELLEAERAGAQVGARLVTDTNDPELKALGHVIRADEVRWCSMLMAAIKALDAEPSPVIGAFYEKTMAIADVEARIAFVNRGQGWVVRKLGALLPQVRDDGLHIQLREMLVAHENNIESAQATLDRRAQTDQRQASQQNRDAT